MAFVSLFYKSYVGNLYRGPEAAESGSIQLVRKGIAP